MTSYSQSVTVETNFEVVTAGSVLSIGGGGTLYGQFKCWAAQYRTMCIRGVSGAHWVCAFYTDL